MEVGYLVDVFDLLNVRDLDLIEQASASCTGLLMGVLSDEDARQFLGFDPVVPFVERLELVSHLRGVGKVCRHDALAVPPAPMFRVADRAALPFENGPLLTPRRGTVSAILQRALRRSTVLTVTV